MAAHDATDGAGSFAVGNHEHVRLERAVDAVERPKPLARACPPHHDLPPGEPVVIEGMHRLTELEQHVVGDVDDIADRADAGGRQSVGEPLRRGPDAHLEHLRAVPRAEIRVRNR